MEFCEDCDKKHYVCDHCAHYNFNGNKDGAYTGDGWCTLHDTRSDPWDDCSHYTCYTLKDKDD